MCFKSSDDAIDKLRNVRVFWKAVKADRIPLVKSYLHRGPGTQYKVGETVRGLTRSGTPVRRRRSSYNGEMGAGIYVYTTRSGAEYAAKKTFGAIVIEVECDMDDLLGATTGISYSGSPMPMACFTKVKVLS